MTQLQGRLCFVPVLILALLGAAPVAAQTTGAVVEGVVTDEQRAVLPGAGVTIVNVETGWTRDLVTDERGWYRAAALPPGLYQLRVEMSGFASVVELGLALTLGQEATINVTLKLATVEETVTVTGGAPLVEATKSTLGTTITRGALDSMPLAGRDFAGLAIMAPGIAGVGGGGVNAAGQTTRSNTYLIDGASADGTVVSGSRGGVSLDAVQEFVVMTNQFSAEYGNASGAIVTVITRSGTNQLQGRLFTLIRDDSLDAANPFSIAQGSGKAPFSQQRYGGFLGGPILRDKLFYFGSYEQRQSQSTAVITSPLVPVSERVFATPVTQHQAFAKADYRLNNQHALAIRYRADRVLSIGNNIGGLNTIGTGTNSTTLNHDMVVNETFVISGRALNEFRFQGAWRAGWQDTDPYTGVKQRPPGGYSPTIPIPHAPPYIQRPSGNFNKARNMPQGWNENRYQFIDNFSYSVGSHNLKTGVDVSVIQVLDLACHDYDGRYYFSTDAPFDPNNAATYPYQYFQVFFDPWTELPENTYAIFVQDSWRARPNLTFNLGLRYDRETGFEKIIGVKDDKNNVQPRLGFVWDPFKNGRTAVRGGYGVYVDQAFTNIQLNVALGQKGVGLTIVNPGYPDPYGPNPNGRGVPEPPSTVTAHSPMETPETRTLSLGVKREVVRGLAVSADVVSSNGYSQYRSLDVNYPDPITRKRPDPSLLVNRQYIADGHSWYSALLLGLERRSGRGPSFGISYTFAKALRDAEDFNFYPQDQNLPLSYEKTLANTQRRHQIVANITWALPGGFQMAALLQGRSGQPWTVTTGRDSNGDLNSNDRPDLAVPGGNPLDKATYSTAFTGRAGNLSRNSNIGPGFFTADVRVSKFVRVRRMRLEAFVEAFNATNRVNLGSPNGNLRSSLFGTSTGIQGNPRQVELGFRFDF